jgi:hypothetical protein
LKHSNLIHPSLNLISLVETCCFISFSLNADNNIGKEAAIKLCEALKSNSSITILNLGRNCVGCFISFSLDIENYMSNEGAIELSEGLKSNSSLSSLNLYCNTLVASFHSHSIQVIILVLKEPLNYMKHSNQIDLSLHSISAVTALLSFHSHSVQIITLILNIANKLRLKLRSLSVKT